MKKNQLLLVTLIYLPISGLLTSANATGNLQKGFLKSNMGLVSSISDNYYNLFDIQEYLDAAIYFENLQNPQKIALLTKRAVQNLDEAIAAMLSSSDPDVNAEGRYLKSLTNDLNPTIYIRNGHVSSPDTDIPKCVDIDASSVLKLYEDNLQYSAVELITIRLEQQSDLSTVLNLANLQNFTSLKYLYILSSFEICTSPGCEAAMISSMVQGTDNSNSLILYKISIPN
jgi:hypothetical protein